MKSTLLCFLVCVSLGCGARVAETPKSDNTSENNMTEPTFDSALAAKLGADPFGMKQYAMVFLKPGAQIASDSLPLERNQELMKGQITYLMGQWNERKMVLVGPFMTEGPISGLCVYDCSVDEAKSRAEGDPRVLAGQLVVEVHPQYGSAALMTIPDMEAKLAFKSILDEFQEGLNL